MIFFLNSFSFSLPHSHIQAGGSFQLRLYWPIWSLLWSWGHWAPFSTAYLDELVEEDLVVLVDCDVLFVRQEIFRLLSLLSILPHLSGYHLCVFDCLIASANTVHFLAMCLHFSIGKVPGWDYCVHIGAGPLSRNRSTAMSRIKGRSTIRGVTYCLLRNSRAWLFSM